MLTFDNLVFHPHPLSIVKGAEGHAIAGVRFNNGWGVSVIFGDMFYSNTGTDEVMPTYEVMVLGPRGESVALEVENISGDGSGVYGWLTPDKVSTLMKHVQQL